MEIFEKPDHKDIPADDREVFKIIRGGLKLLFVFLIVITMQLWSCNMGGPV